MKRKLAAAIISGLLMASAPSLTAYGINEETEMEQEDSLEQKINQMIIVPVDYALNHDANYGGIIYLGKDLKGKTFEQVRQQNMMLSNRGIRPLIMLDQEGGKVDRLRYLSDFEENCNPATKRFIDKYNLEVKYFRLPSQEDILNKYLNSENPVEFLEDYSWYAYGIAETLYRAGFNLNLAPVADLVPEDGKNSVIASQDRNFGSDPEVAIQLLRAYFRGFNSFGKVLSCLKHFPGEGYTNIDTHGRKAVIDLPMEELYENIRPFEALKDEATAIMLSHAIYPEFDDMPASGSSKLRDLVEDHYQGILISDDISMHALDEFDRYDLIPKACDMIILLRGNVKDVYAGIMSSLDEKEIQERYEKIRFYKENLFR